MGRPRNINIDRVQYLGMRVVHMMMHCWPVHLNLRLAQIIGDVVYRIDKRHRLRAIGNISRSFPHLDAKEVDRLARESVRQMIMLFVEVLFTTRLVRLDTFTTYVRLGHFEETLDVLMQRHRGLIMMTGHYGNWEILGYVMALLGFPSAAVARPLDNKYINEWLLGVREKMGQRIVNKKGATNIVTETLDQHGVIAFIADQNAGPKGLFVDFFGRKASTYKSIGLLAMQYEVPIVVGYARRLGNHFKFELGTQDIIYPEDWKDQDNPLHYITQRYTKAIEDFVSAEPGQYLWVHRRWKSRPKGEAPEAFD